MQSLIENVLIGTEKKQLDLTVLPQPIQEFVQSRDYSSEEVKFLETVALSYYYQEAGKVPAIYEGEWSEQRINETKEIAPSELLKLFDFLDTIDYQIKEIYFNQWLQILIDRNNRINPELVTKLLTAGKNFSSRTKSKIIEVIGSRGQWALTYSPEQHYVIPKVNENVWQEGNNQERKTLFTVSRQQHPQEALALLESTWATESITNKKSFLDIIAETVVATDVPFLENLFETEFKYHAKEKKTEKECRKIVATTLLRYPQSKLYQLTTQQLATYFTKAKKGLLGFVTGKEPVSFSIKETDPFWSVSHIEQTYGFESKAYDIAVFNSAPLFWLSQFIESVSLSFWIDQFDQDYERFIRYFLNDDQFKTKINGNTIAIYQQALVNHALGHNHTKLAETLVEYLSPQDSLPLLKLIQPQTFEQFVKKHKYFTDAEVLASGPFDEHHLWSVAFSQLVLIKTVEWIQQNQYPAHGKIMAQYLHPDILLDLQYQHQQMVNNTYFGAWNKQIYEPVQASLHIKTILNSYKK